VQVSSPPFPPKDLKLTRFPFYSGCRRSKVKCDEGKPACGNCDKRGLICDYSRPLIYINETSRLTAAKPSRKRARPTSPGAAITTAATINTTITTTAATTASAAIAPAAATAPVAGQMAFFPGAAPQPRQTPTGYSMTPAAHEWKLMPYKLPHSSTETEFFDEYMTSITDGVLEFQDWATTTGGDKLPAGFPSVRGEAVMDWGVASGAGDAPGMLNGRGQAFGGLDAAAAPGSRGQYYTNASQYPTPPTSFSRPIVPGPMMAREQPQYQPHWMVAAEQEFGAGAAPVPSPMMDQGPYSLSPGPSAFIGLTPTPLWMGQGFQQQQPGHLPSLATAPLPFAGGAAPDMSWAAALEDTVRPPPPAASLSDNTAPGSSTPEQYSQQSSPLPPHPATTFAAEESWEANLEAWLRTLLPPSPAPFPPMPGPSPQAQQHNTLPTAAAAPPTTISLADIIPPAYDPSASQYLHPSEYDQAARWTTALPEDEDALETPATPASYLPTPDPTPHAQRYTNTAPATTLADAAPPASASQHFHLPEPNEVVSAGGQGEREREEQASEWVHPDPGSLLAAVLRGDPPEVWRVRRP
jgi:Fungal Zn(2)-Cys(6) binuclear cluster domain